MFDFGIKDCVDIVLVAFLLYYIYRLMRDTKSLNVFLGILIFVVVWIFVSHILEMRLMGAIMDKLISVGMLALIVIFQEEIREFLYSLGTRKQWSFIHDLFTSSSSKQGDKDTLIVPVVMACMNMSKGKVGALIVMQRTTDLQKIADTGDILDARIDQRLIENLFFKNSPLHDGAMIIADGRIQAAGCILPVSHNQNIPKRLGLRHRAGLGVSEETDAVVVVVSEETGEISVAINGKFRIGLSAENLEILLTEELLTKR